MGYFIVNDYVCHIVITGYIVVTFIVDKNLICLGIHSLKLVLEQGIL